MCCVNATYFGTCPLGKTLRPQLHATGVSSPRGFRCRLKLIFDPGLDQAARVGRKNVAVLAERVFVQEQPGRIVFRILDQVRREVMDHLEALRVGRLALDRHHVHVFREAGVDQHVHDVVGAVAGSMYGFSIVTMTSGLPMYH